LTGYDGKDAVLLDECGVDIILVGDSLGNVRLGFQDTKSVTMEHMALAVNDVASARPKAKIVADLPLGSYDNRVDGLSNALRLLSCGADAVKLEGGRAVADTVSHITDAGADVMGHIGHTPQTDVGHRIRGKTESEALGLIDDAVSLEDAGAFALVLELVDADVAGRVTDAVGIPTIGIGAGAHVGGQVLVLDDLLGWTDFSGFPRGQPTFIGGGWDRSSPENAVRDYVRRVKEGSFPSDDECYRVYVR
jgi:3-methyl-2-oxobutanoate hydroxymethyltransferase